MFGEPYRVLYLNHTGMPGGAEFALSRMLGAVNHDVVRPIVVLGGEGHAVELMRSNNVETHVVSLPAEIRDMRKDTIGPKTFLNLKRAAMLFGYAARMAAFARKNRIQIIHTNTIKAHIYGAIAGCIAGVPVVWHVRDYVDETYLPPSAVKVVRWLARFAPKHVIGVSNGVMEQLRLKDGGKRSSVVLDGLSERELFGSSHDGKAALPRANARIGIVGRLARWKGQHIFLEAAAKIINAGYDAKFVIVGAALFGEEDYEAELRQQVKSLGIEASVEFRGFARDIPSELRNLDILVHASITGEPFGQVIVEGMAVGKPVIATRGGGVPEIITDGENGMLTTMGDAEGLARQVVFLLENPETAARLGKAAFEHVRQKFKASFGARKIESVYRNVLGEERLGYGNVGGELV